MKDYSEDKFKDNMMNRKCLFIGGGLGEGKSDWTLCDEDQIKGTALCQEHHDISRIKRPKRKKKPTHPQWITKTVKA